LIDGYNLIKRNPTLAHKRLEDGRQALLNFIERERPQGSDRNPVTVVFDGKPGMSGGPVATQTSIIFTEYESADERIKGIVEDAANKKEIVVVTNDRDLLLYVRKLGAKVMSVDEFIVKGRPAKTSAAPSDKGKFISATFEYKINQEFEKIWITDLPSVDKEKDSNKKPKA